jgi:lactate dehydrogenase-like 2-hydroxyacid dehydrogenase
LYEREAQVNERLVKNKRALLIPHLGSHTTEMLAQMEELAMENARPGVMREELLTLVPDCCQKVGSHITAIHHYYTMNPV